MHRQVYSIIVVVQYKRLCFLTQMYEFISLSHANITMYSYNQREYYSLARTCMQCITIFLSVVANSLDAPKVLLCRLFRKVTKAPQSIYYSYQIELHKSLS